MSLPSIFVPAALCLLACSCASNARNASGDSDASQAFELPSQPATPEHAWLMQLVGEWDAASEIPGEAGAEPFLWKSQESVHALGDHWIVAKGSPVEGGDPFASRLTIGYDTAQSTFVGSWIDTTQTMMWTYRGELDREENILTLRAEGPSFSDPTQTAQYRDQLQLISPDRKRMTSSVLNPDGQWKQFMNVEYRRVK